MVDTGNDPAGQLRRRLSVVEERVELESGLRATQAAELTALGVVQRGLLGTVQSVRETQLEHGIVLTDQTRRLGTLEEHLGTVDLHLEGLDATVDNLDLHVEELDAKVDEVAEDVVAVRGSVERILAILEPD